MLRFLLIIAIFSVLLSCGPGATELSPASSTYTSETPSPDDAAPAPPVSTVSCSLSDVRSIVPGISFGAIDADVTAEKLRRIYGEVNVKAAADDAFVVDGTLPVSGFYLYPDTPDELVITFPNPEEGVDYITITAGNPNGTWRMMDNGIHVGSKLAEVEAANGNAFYLQSGAMEGAGEIDDLRGGKLKTASLRFAPAGAGDLPASSNLPDGAHLLSSDDDRLQELDVRVAEIVLYLDPAK